MLESLQESNALFRQIRADIEQAYQVGTPDPPLHIYMYHPSDSENLFSVAARLLLPYSTIATLNGITSAQTVLGNQTILLPNQPGIFSSTPDREDAQTESIAFAEPIGPDRVSYFFPGEDYTPSERREFFENRFSFPVASPRVTSGYGMRISPITRVPLLHNGVDFGGRTNSEVLAAADGVIVSIEWSQALGFYIEIQHDEKLSTIYGHLSQIGVNYGQQVSRSEIIGRMGTTGLTTGPHVHFEIRYENSPVDPFSYLPKIDSP